jgi:DNA gyrase subunit A
VRQGTDVMLVTNAGRLIRVPGDQVRITGRQAMGVTLFRVDGDECVTAVFPVIETVTELEEEQDETPGGASPDSEGQADMDEDSLD